MNGKNDSRSKPEGVAAMPDRLAMPASGGFEDMLGFMPGDAGISRKEDADDDGR